MKTVVNIVVPPAVHARILIWASTFFPAKKKSSHVMKTGFHGAGAWLKITNFRIAGTVRSISVSV